MRKRIRRAKELRNWKRVVEKIAEAAKEELGDEVRVYIFGSAARGELTASSDVDILISSPPMGRIVPSPFHPPFPISQFPCPSIGHSPALSYSRD